jgi:Protein of unknown function (DUF3128)
MRRPWSCHGQNSGGPCKPEAGVSLRHLPLDPSAGIMGDSAMADTTAFRTVVAQEEARLHQLHPTFEDIPSCMTVFDDFLSCNSTPFFLAFSCPSALRVVHKSKTVLGTQLKSIYRFGEMAHCSAKWNEFKFCMSIKGLHPEQRRNAWIRHRAEWWARRRLGPSSENVWEKRAYVVGPIRVFS